MLCTESLLAFFSKPKASCFSSGCFELYKVVSSPLSRLLLLLTVSCSAECLGRHHSTDSVQRLGKAGCALGRHSCAPFHDCSVCTEGMVPRLNHSAHLSSDHSVTIHVDTGV